MARLILASASPRRAGILRMLHMDFEIRPANADERLPAGISPEAAVEMLARRKGQAVAAGDPSQVILSADTLVWLDVPEGASPVILGKPADMADAARMLGLLSGREHKVSSGISLIRGDKIASAVVTTAVRFRKLDGAEIARYVASGDPLDKAGGYGIQGPACVFIEGITGDCYNVAGLPVCALDELSRDFLGCPLCGIGEL